MLLAPVNAVAITIPPEWKGDVNLDGEIDIDDVTTLTDALLNGDVFDSMDVTQDGKANIDDVTSLIDMLLVMPRLETFKVNGVSFTMRYVREASFTMGATGGQIPYAGQNEYPAHEVELPPYFICRTEVTQALWHAVMGDNPCHFKGYELPVEWVTWDECQEFVYRLSQMTGRQFRLPTEAEWEFAANSAHVNLGCLYSGSDELDSVGWFADNSNGAPNQVRTKGRNGIGLFDMSGNVNEWCYDWFAPYNSGSQFNPIGPQQGTVRVIRGGSWSDESDLCRVTSRQSHDPAVNDATVGLRIAMDAVDPYWFTLSRRTVRLEVGEQAAVDILNGNGSYTIHNNSTSVTQAQVNGNNLTVRALKEGVAVVTVIDRETQVPSTLTVIVTAPVESWTVNVGGVNFKMIPVQGGNFVMGATPEMATGSQSNERPAHDVTLTDYCLGETEVTQALWQAVMGTNPSYFTSGDHLQRPVERVSWEDCWEFIYKLNELTGMNFRLPTEADWEYAARGGRKTQGYTYAGGNNLNDVAWNAANAYAVGSSSPDYGTHTVATKAPNELGLYDMSGNVLEWCENLNDAYSHETHVNPAGATGGTNRICRGGSWHASYSDCRLSRRYTIVPNSRQSYRGLRLAISTPGQYTFHLTKTVVKLETGEQRSVNIINGSGDYSLYNQKSTVMSCSTNGDVLTVTGSSTGTTSVIVKDNKTHALTWLTVIVTNPANYHVKDFDIRGISFRMIYIPQGIFAMGGTEEQGASATSAEKPVHRVALSDYYIGETEVTRALWYAVMGYTPRIFDDDMKHPKADISWEECQVFVARLSAITGYPFRLPTEAEWEYAARGARRSKGYKYAGGNSLASLGWYKTNSNDSTHYVALKRPNEMGIYDMSGNVDEWCQDWYENYTGDITYDPMGPDEGQQRVVRGGAYNNTATDCRVSSRRPMDPETESSGIGLRLAMDFDNHYRLYLSRTVVWMEVGDVENVRILNGTGDYTITDDNDGIVDFELTGDNIRLTGTKVGTAHFYIKDNVTNSRRLLTVIVTKSSHAEYRELKYKSISWWMMYVRDGAFDMGGTEEQGTDPLDNEKPVHRVALNDYYIGQTEVTQELWNAVMYNDWRDLGEDAKKPVESVNWEECQEFVARLNEIFAEYDLNFRLPTEAEWEFAARGGNRSRGYKYAGSNNMNTAGWYMGNAQTPDDPYHAYARRPVKTKIANELGIYDMSGNAAEWCEDWYGPYAEGGQFNPVGPVTSTERVLRSGTYSSAARDCRVSSRLSMIPVWWSIPNGVGLRLAMDATGTHRFYLSRRVVRMLVGEHVDVNIHNGTGEYEITGVNNGIVNMTREGETISLTGLKVGTATFVVTDTVTGERCHLTAIVTEQKDNDMVKIDIDSLVYNMIYVRGGTFTMGQNGGDNILSDPDEAPEHQVTLSNYYIGETEVTQQLWQKVMGGNPSRFKGGIHPVERVTWEDCQEFVRRLNGMTGRSFRLPTEAEWEYAARGGHLTRGYPYSGSYTLGNVAWYASNSGNTTQAVKTRLPNELGIYDMSGNVWEWCQDVYGAYSPQPQYNPVGPEAVLDTNAMAPAIYRVFRGGAWNSDAYHCRVTQRNDNHQGFADYNIGLRLAMDAPTSTALLVSPRVIYMEVGDVSTVNILNGTGSYTATGGSDVVSYQLSGNTMTITGLKVGTTTINVRDNVTGYYTVVTVIVSTPSIPYQYKTITFWIKYVWGGSFDMGATDEQAGVAATDESPVHRVLVPTYGLGMTEVTQELWRAVMGFNPSVNTGDDKLPVDNVTWDEAQEFVARLSDYFDVNFRLPTEAEWEYAARGAWRHKPYLYSGSNTIGNVAWYSGNSGGKTHVVQTKQRNDEWIYDMSGNIDEWCQDWYGPYSNQPVFEPVGPDSAEYHVVRGGRWNSNAAACRVSARATDESLETLPGVRIALELDYDYWFSLSRSVVSMYVGDTRTVNVRNGSGNYTVTATNAGIVNTQVNGDQLVLTGLKKGRTRLTVYDNVAQDFRTLTVIVNERTEPDLPDNDENPFGEPFKMVYVRGGTFTMGATSEQGSDAYSQENPAHTVTVPSFRMSNIEVTQGLWKAIMGTNPSNFTGNLRMPVENVSWAECQEFIARLNERTGKNYRLPTEAEWEYAARGGVKTKGYKYSGSNTIGNVAWYSGNSGSTTHVVGTKSPNELGIYDMSGNVFEWCQDWYGSYTDGMQTDPTGPETGTLRVRRGGGWSSAARASRVSYRTGTSPTVRSNIYGLRLAQDVENSTWFGLSKSVIRLEQYERRKINILNGHGSYTVTGGGNIVSCQIDGEQLTVTGLQIGTVSIAVTDNTTGLRAYLTVVVTEPDAVDIGPVIPGPMVFSMVHVTGGTFMMGATSEQGSDAFSNENPAHEVTLPDFYISNVEITQSLWEWVMGSNPSYHSGDAFYVHRPVENVSWEDCQLFIAKLNALTGESFRLPTEAEWEFAARGGNKSRGYKFAGSDTLDVVGWYSGNSGGQSQEVFGKRGNELNLYDMSGNVYEWCQDLYGAYNSTAQNNPTGPAAGSSRIRRGGYFSASERYCRVSYRNYASPTSRNRYTGLRLAMDYVTTYSFMLSQSVIQVEVGETKSVDLINGGGNYAVTGGAGNVTWALNGDQLAVTGVQVGTTTLAVTDIVSGSVRPLTVVVTEASMPEEEEFDVNGIKFKMITVDGGTFMMGDNSIEESSPAHQVTLSTYKIGQTEVTQALWEAVMSGQLEDDASALNYAVPFVTWDDCQEFLLKLNQLTGKKFRLLTEAEWEFAARGGNRSHGYTYSGSNTIDGVAWYKSNSSGFNPIMGTYIDVATKAPNELGIYDMSGGVWELCQDFYGGYTAEPQTNPTGPAQSDFNYHVTRGGSFAEQADQCRVAVRGTDPLMFLYGYGFRLALDVDDSPKFRLSETAVKVEVGESASVNLINGSGNYTVTGGTDYVTTSISGNTLTVTGTAAGTTAVYVTDTATGATAVLTVIVTEAAEEPDNALIEDWEGCSAGGYWTQTVQGHCWTWHFTDAGIWKDDQRHGELSCRFGKTANSAIEMAEDVEGSINAVSFYAGSFGNDIDAALRVDYSVDHGSNWLSLGSVTATQGSFNYYSFNVNVVGSARFRIVQTSGVRVDIDDIAVHFSESILPEDEFEVNGVKFKMITVDGGTFMMGAPDDDDEAINVEKPAHQVTLSTYKIGETEVTQALWKAVMGSYYDNAWGYTNEDLIPVAFIPWNECQEFISKLNSLTGKHFRLPFEAEWEFAARGGNLSQGYLYAGSNNIDDVAWYCDNTNSSIKPFHVATKAPNELGLYDMTGNVNEWCQDIYGEYSASAQVNPTGPTTGNRKVSRGGAWYYEPQYCRISFRDDGWVTGYDWRVCGFRLTLDPDDNPKFHLSETVMTVEVGESKSVNIINGGSSYTVANSNNYVTTVISGNKLTVTGSSKGITTVYVTDAATGATAVLTVIVTEATMPEEPEYVDLGLPSGTLWATKNIGANKPEDYGDYFSWGETEPKTVYDWSTYKWCNGTRTTLTKYCTDSSYGTVDNKTELDIEDDVAYIKWGPSWRIPSNEQMKELTDNCTWQWTTRNSVNGYLVTGPNGNKLFLPAAGAYFGNSLYDDGINGYYWLPTLNDECSLANGLYISSGIWSIWGNEFGSRCSGFTVRAVYVSTPSVTPLSLPVNELTAFVNSDHYYTISNGSGSFSVAVNGTSVLATIESGSLHIQAVTTGVSTVTVTDLVTGDAASVVVTVIPLQRGDVNCDGVINENDYGELYSIVVQNKTPQSTYTADVNADGTIDKNISGYLATNTDINALIDILYNDLMPSWSGYPFNDISAYSAKYDINGDGVVSISDFPSIIDIVLNGSGTYGNGDLDGDGLINWRDACIFHVAFLRLNGLWPDDAPEEESFTVNGVTFKMVTVDGGTFTMGDDSDFSAKPAHQVTLSDYKIGQTEVTQELWQAVMGTNPSYYSNINGYIDGMQRPVESVSWNDCQRFILKLNELTGKKFRMPTEAEWEFAALGGNKSKGYQYSGSNNADEVAWYGIGPGYELTSNNYKNNHIKQYYASNPDTLGPRPVATKAPNELGIYDMSGNICEMCQDWYATYSNTAQTNPTGPASGSEHSWRGGCWIFLDCSIKVRWNIEFGPTGRVECGLRLALDPDDSPKFRLSETVVSVEEGKSTMVYVINGSGSISVSGGTDNCTVAYSTDRLIVVGDKAGTCTVTVTDNNSGAKTVLTIIVTEAPELPPTDGQNYQTINGVKIENVWIQDRVHTPDEWASMPYCNINARTAVLHNGDVYISRSNVSTAGGSVQSYVYQVNGKNGQLVREIPLTLNGSIYGNTILSANNIGVDDFGHLYISPYSADNTRYHPIYLLNESTGELTLIKELDKGNTLSRLDYIDIVGDLTRQQAECNVMMAGANSNLVYRWHAAKGGEFIAGFNGQPSLAIQNFSPETVSHWGYAPVVKMILGESENNRYSGERFYVDGYTAAPLLYNINGDLLDSFKDAPSECQPMSISANGLCQFELGEKRFLAYSAAEYTGYNEITGEYKACQAYISQLGNENEPLSNMLFYWMVPDAFGCISDGGIRVQSINVEYGTDEAGNPEVTLFILRCYNGMGVYKITLDSTI